MKIKAYNDTDLIYAINLAADALDLEEWHEEDGGSQEAAYREVSKRLRKMADRVIDKQIKNEFKKEASISKMVANIFTDKPNTN